LEQKRRIERGLNSLKGRKILELLDEIERVYKEGWGGDRELKEMERDLKNQS